MPRAALLVFGLTLATSCASAPEHEPVPATHPELDAWFERTTSSMPFSGSAVYAKGGEVEWQRFSGLADLETERALDAHSIFELASVGKAFTAMAVLTLVDAGKLELDAPVSDVVRGFPSDAITARHLLNHTAGLPDYLEHLDPGAAEFYYPRDVVGWLIAEEVPVHFAPGERFEYSNTGYVLLAYLVEVASGQDFGSYLSSHVFGPLGMQRTYSFTGRYTGYELPVDYAYGYVADEGGAWVLPESLPGAEFLRAFSTMHGYGTVVGDLRDLAKWRAAWTTDVLVPAELRDQALRSGVLNDGTETGYGFAWMIADGYVMHTGGWPGYSTFVVMDLEGQGGAYEEGLLAAFAVTSPITGWSWAQEFEQLLFPPADAELAE